MKFLLDTNICIYAMNRHSAVVHRLGSHTRDEIGVSAISEAELRYGVAKSAVRAKNARVLEAFLLPFEILDFTSREAETYGEIRAHLERAGQPIGPTDTLIAAHARARHLTLVTNNEREFRRVPGLKIENWAT